MSCTTVLSPSASAMLSSPRKRTSSFSTPTTNSRPNKAPRMSMLCRTLSFASLPVEQSVSVSEQRLNNDDGSMPYQRSKYKEQRQKRRQALSRTRTESSIHLRGSALPDTPPPPVAPPAPIVKPKATLILSSTVPPKLRPRVSSPLAPVPQRTTLPPRASFPRSKTEPDLYKIAIIKRMRCSPEGQKILTMGPRLAVSILTATKELEKLVAKQMQTDGIKDVTMADGTVDSWVVIPGEDWEMVDCGA